MRRVAHPLAEVLLLVVCGTIADCDDYEAIGAWGVALHLNVRLPRFAIITAVKHEIRGPPESQISCINETQEIGCCDARILAAMVPKWAW